MYSPHAHMQIAYQRHEDMLRRAERDRLASLFEDERPSTFSRLRARLSRREESPRPVTSPC
ncbi:MAG TPA: hypothetical protein VFW80_11790 [Gaiellaceae bacterium]|nr:hypothetical protein [Gaiellaceae bacterium]